MKNILLTVQATVQATAHREELPEAGRSEAATSETQSKTTVVLGQ